MTDPVQTLAPDPTLSPTPAQGTPAPADDGKSPLDVLDQILKDAQGKAKDAVAEKNAEELAKREADREKQRKLDADKVRQQLLGIAQAKESPEYQAAVSQRKEEEEKKDAYDQKMDGMEIVQLEHAKL